VSKWDEKQGRESAEPEVLRRIGGSEAVEVARAFFSELPERQREVFDLVELQGYTATEAAEMLVMSPSTVRVHLLRARRTLRTRIMEQHPALAEDFS
jgi:RNA polymerase sigma factor (sigma-70 family)